VPDDATPSAAGSRVRGRGRLARRLCLLGVAGGLAGLLLPWLTPWWLGFDVFAHFAVHFVIVIVACLVGWLLPRHHVKVALALMLAGGLGLASIGFFWRAAPPPAQAGAVGGNQAAAATAGGADAGIRVMTFNTWTKNHDLRALAEEILRHGVDFAGLVEFEPPKPRLGKLLAGQFPHVVDCNDIPFCYMGFVSRWPVEKVKARSLWRGPPYLHVRVHTPHGPVRVLLVHTLRFPWLGSQLKQMRAIADIVQRAEKSGEPVIVMGDFNATPFSVMLKTFQRSLGLRRITWIPTWPTQPLPLPQLAIDHMFISSHFTVRGGPYTGRPAGSDHLPVIADLALRPADRPRPER